MKFTQHALDRFQERSCIRDVGRAMKRLEALIIESVPLNRTKHKSIKYRYKDGWILMFQRGVLQTVYTEGTKSAGLVNT